MSKRAVSPAKETGKAPKVITSAKDAERMDALNEEIRVAIWPNYDHEKFLKILDDWPELTTLKHGTLQETLLHRACRYGNKKVAVTLLDRGCTPCLRNARGVTPLHLACQYRHMDIAKMLLNKGAQVDEPDDFGDQPIHSAAKSGCIGCVGLLYEWGAKVCTLGPGHNGNTVIHYAAKMGRLKLVDHLLNMGPLVNLENYLKETPLHLAAGLYTKENDYNVDVIERLLSGGAKLDARTAWGDTAVHYAGRWGTHRVLEYLLDEGIPVDKSEGALSKDFCETHKISEEEAANFGYTLLQKTAKSTCILKNTIIMDRMMRARTILAKNMYYSTRGNGDEEIIEMNPQQLEFLKLSKEFYEQKEDQAKSTLEMYLKYCPDALNHLFDTSIMKPCLGQVQGTVYFDFFLFTPQTNSRSELSVIDTLISYGKERFLIHPIFEVFVELKWYRTWKYYLVFVFLYLLFLMALAGFTLLHLGNIYDGAPKYDQFQEHTVIWTGLAICHGYVSIMALANCVQMTKFLCQMIKTSKGNVEEGIGTYELLKRGALYMATNLRTIAIPVLVGIILYLPVSKQVARYFAAIAIILACDYFMGIISRLPGVGLYVHMLSKVTVTVLNFFATYVWSFLGFAIAFHILLPADGPYGNFADAFIKVVTMLLGEYEYTNNFINIENPDSYQWIAKVIFLLFLLEMSVVMMNLVLGLAVSDIDALQRNSAVQRMVQKTHTVMFIDGILNFLSRIPCFGSCFNIKITGDRACTFKDIYYLELVDLEDPNSSNRLGVEIFPKDPKYYTCPHTVVVSITKIIQGRIVKEFDLFNSQKKNESPENSAIQAQIAHLVGEMIGIKKTLQDFIKNHPLDS